MDSSQFTNRTKLTWLGVGSVALVLLVLAGSAFASFMGASLRFSLTANERTVQQRVALEEEKCDYTWLAWCVRVSE